MTREMDPSVSGSSLAVANAVDEDRWGPPDTQPVLDQSTTDPSSPTTAGSE